MTYWYIHFARIRGTARIRAAGLGQSRSAWHPGPSVQHKKRSIKRTIPITSFGTAPFLVYITVYTPNQMLYYIIRKRHSAVEVDGV